MRQYFYFLSNVNFQEQSVKIKQTEKKKKAILSKEFPLCCHQLLYWLLCFFMVDCFGRMESINVGGVLQEAGMLTQGPAPDPKCKLNTLLMKKKNGFKLNLLKF